MAATEPHASWLARVGWFVLIWAASVLALGAIAALMRLVMHLAGAST